MSQNSFEGTQQQKLEQQQEQQQQNSNAEQTVTELALQQAQVGLNMLWLIQQIQQQQQQQQVEDVTGTTPSPSSPLSGQPNGSPSLCSALSNLFCLNNVSAPPICSSPLIPPTQRQANSEEKRRRDLAIIGRRWEYVSDVLSFAEFEQLRCRHQVSRNRTFAHGIRYSCTQKTQLRSNCPYLLLCLFSDGAGEHSATGVGAISVYSRNKHTHPVKVIKARQPRRFAKMAKKEQQREDKEETEKTNKKKGMGGKGKARGEIGDEKEEKREKEETKEEEEEEKMEETGEALIEILSKMLAEQQKEGEGAKNEIGANCGGEGQN